MLLFGARERGGILQCRAQRRAEIGRWIKAELAKSIDLAGSYDAGPAEAGVVCIRASVVTDHIETFTPTGIRLKSGEELEADILPDDAGRGADVELEALRAACRVTDHALSVVLAKVAPGVSERQVARWLDDAMRELTRKKH